MKFYPICSVVLIISLTLCSWSFAFAGDISGALEEGYFSEFDKWIAEGGDPDQIQEVVKTCGKLVMLYASASEIVMFNTIDRDEWDFRIDVCTKMIVHRVYSQPEFENPKIVNTICREGDNALFKKMCRIYEIH